MTKLKRKHWILLICSALFILCAFIGTASAATVYVPDNYAKIRWAVDNSSAGDTIIVRDGTYTENVVVNTSLTIRSENGSASTTVVASNPFEHVFKVSADYVNISGFTMKNPTLFDCPMAGIFLGNVDHCAISNNTATNNVFGIWLESSGSNTLTGNTANSNNDIGIFLMYSNSNTLTGNTANSNNNVGILLMYSNSNTLTGNTANSNNVFGIWLEGSSNNLIYDNSFSNANNAHDDGSNIWNTTKTAGTNIIGGPFLGGNHWSDYTEMDTDGDGLGDTSIPYNSSGNIRDGGDYLPLITPIPQTETTDIIDSVNVLVDEGVLNQGQGRALIEKLELVINKMDQGNAKTAIKLLQSFVNTLDAYIYAGILTPDQGQSLIDPANEIMNAISGK